MADGIAFTVGDQTPEANVSPISLSSPAPMFDDKTVTDRAARADFALGDKSPGPEVLKDQFNSGAEPMVRQAAASQADVEFRQEKLNQIKSTVAKGGKLEDTEINGLMAVGTTPEANPETVLEDKFAKNMVTAGVVGDPGKNLVFQSAFNTVPERTREGIQIANSAISRKYQAKDVQEIAERAYKNLPWVPDAGSDQEGKLGSHIRDIGSLGIYQYVAQRNLINSDPINSWLPGSNKMEQIESLYLLHHQDFKPALMAAAGPESELWKKSPTQAMDFLRAAVMFSTSDMYTENIYGVMNVAGLLPITTGLRLLGRLRGAAATGSEVTTAEKVAQDVLAGSPKRPVTPGEQAQRTAAEVLAGSPRSPEQGYYIPEAAVKRPWEAAPRTGSFSVDQKGKPAYTTDDGASVEVSRVPQAGHIKITPQEPTVKNQYITKEGTFDYTPEGVAGKGKTVYVDKKGYEKLSQVLDEDKNLTLLDAGNGKMHVGDLDHQTPGKMVKGSSTTISDTPKEGLYPIHLPEGTDKIKFEDFGSRITQVNEQRIGNVRFGPTIVEPAEQEARVALADIVRSQGADHPQDMLSVMGQHGAAAEVGAQEILTSAVNGTVPLRDANAMRRLLPSNAQPGVFFNNSSSLSNRRARELADEAQARSTVLADRLSNPTRVERLPPQAEAEAIAIAKTAIQKYNRASDSIRDQIVHYDPESNLKHIETRFTKRGGDLYDTRATAEWAKNMDYRLGTSATVEQEGNKFYISHIQHVDETQSGARNLIVVNNETPRMVGNFLNPRNWLDLVAKRITGNVGTSITSSAGTVSQFQRQQRITATHAPSVLRDAIETESKALEALGGVWSKTERQELEQMLVHNRDYIPPGGTGVDRGFFYPSALDFEMEFQGKFNKLPSEKQVAAYDSYVRLSDLDWTLRELNNLRDKARQGVRNYRFDFRVVDNATGIPQKGKTDWINGKQVKDFSPLNTADANVYILPEEKFTTKYDLKDGSAFSEAVNDKLKSGEYQIIQMYDPRSKPMQGATGVKADIHFVVTNKFDERAVAFGENVPYRPGGHVIYTDQHYVKQPQIAPGPNGRPTHYGDVAVKAFPSQREAERWAGVYDQARQLLKAGDHPGFDAHVTSNLPETPQELRGRFSDGTFNLDHPFVHTLAGRDTIQSNEALGKQYQGLKDTFTSYNMKQNEDSAFLQDRGVQLDAIKNVGTEANPIYNNVAAELLDPYTALSKGMGQIVRSRWMSDYKIEAAESWIQEFGTLFDQSKLPIEKLRQNPIYYLNHLDAVDKGIAKANPEMYTAAMVSRDNILQFIGSQDEVGTVLDGLQLKMLEGIESVGGRRVAKFAEERALPAITQAPAYARAATFHLTSGMYAPVQIWQQGIALFNALAISPINGVKGLTASTLTRLYSATEDATLIASMADKAAALGWNRDHFLEAYQAWKDSGVSNIGGEVTMLSHTSDPTLFKSTWGQFIDKGQMFFRAGDRAGRDVSWFTAYLDLKDKDPTRVFDNRAKTEVYSRYDTMNMNMTRASNTSYNEGIASIPTQYWTWNLRFTEQMLGKQLTIPERARLAGANAMLWGIPSTIGGITFGAVNYDDIKTYAERMGINVHSKWYQIFQEGLPTALLNSITGHETSLQRLGPNATQLRDIIDGKKAWVDVMAGASGQMTQKLFSATYPAVAWAFSGFKQNSGYRITGNDVLNGLENWSAFNTAEKAIVAYNTGKYVAKNETFVAGNIDTFESVMIGLGMSPQRVNDAYRLQGYEKAEKSVKDKLGNQMMQDWKLAIGAMHRGDNETATVYMNRVHVNAAAANFSSKEEADLMKKAMKSQESLLDTVNKKWLARPEMYKDIPAVKQWFENRK